MHYQPSARAYPGRLAELSYPENYVVKRVQASGNLKWLGREWYVAGLLRGEHIGLKPIDDGVWFIFVGMVCVGRLDARATRLEPINTSIDVPTLH